MATIGTFTANADNSFSGAIHTLSINLKAVQFRPVTDKPGDKSPDFRVFAGKAELGAAWKKTSEAGREYLSVTLDDPSFPATVYARLIEGEDGTHDLIWSRSKSTA